VKISLIKIRGSWIVDRGSWIVDWSRTSTDRKTQFARTKDREAPGLSSLFFPFRVLRAIRG
jgi:hypothetical protein